MPVVPCPLPVDPPPLPGNKRSEIGLLWASAEKAAQILRALIGGKLVEWHEDEVLYASDVALIPHGLARRPRFVFFGQVSEVYAVAFVKERSTDSRVALKTNAAAGKSATVSFLLL